ncbi:O-antigen ligase family protein [Halomonas sp. LR3S48]|uniref:O-antigen ligase family protein n=1 Tax=Halomonas sp. LR3S48 TaxID=2982694 RepID=UPI0021E3A5C0|nr:O-antigen ligase family protein [Halomonas sp. LR3S48]UYG02163.1 O-antigen ligase family protein [Halomonas sp. LR3S48]
MSQATSGSRIVEQGDSSWRWVHTILLGAFVSLLLLVPCGYKAVSLVALMLALAGAMLRRDPIKGARQRMDREDRLWLLSLIAFSGLWCMDAARSGVFASVKPDDEMMPLWSLLAAGLMMWWRRYPPSRVGLWLGLVVGGVGVGVIALYERFVLGAYRADNGMNAIPFGNLSLLLGVLALVAMLGRLDRPFSSWSWLTPALGLSAVAGLAASFLSGTRGGWVAVPLLAWMSYGAFYPFLPRHRLLQTAGGGWLLVVALVAMTTITGYGVTQRVERAIDDVRGYVIEGDGGSSVGLRFEMWQAGGRMFMEKPLLGWGDEGLKEARDMMVNLGLLHPGAIRHDQLHSDLVDTAARRGLLGVLALLAFYGVPAVLFARHLRCSRDIHARVLALSGLLIVTAFIGFGLTQSMLRDVRGLSGYLGLSMTCWVLLKARLAELGRTPNVGTGAAL